MRRIRDSYRVFIGPKRPDLLAQYYGRPTIRTTRSRTSCTTAGRSSAPWPARCSAILHFFYGIVGNYGIAIIMLTVLVRGAMFPISYKQTQNMARMQALKPEMDRINEKYKTDMQKKSQATAGAVSQAQDQSAGRLLAGVLAVADLHRAVSRADGRCRAAAVAAVRRGDSLVLEPRGAGHVLELVVGHAGLYHHGKAFLAWART